MTVVAEPPEGRPLRFRAIVRVDTPRELEHYRSGGILPYALDDLLGSGGAR
jgi:aconitate hydratase